MSTEPGKFICPTCNAKLREPEILSAANPFDPNDLILGCPKCRDVVHFDSVCDEPGCWELHCCGFPIGDGSYRMTCSKHYHALSA